MPRRTRKLIGAVAMLAFVAVYALAVMAMAEAPAVREASGLVRGMFYVIGGIGWIAPMMPLIKWMERRDD